MRLLRPWLLLLPLLAACSEKHAATTEKPGAAPATPAAPLPTAPAAAAPAPTGTDSVARQPLTLAQLPAALRPAGQLLEAWRWQDVNGDNVLVASRTVAAGVGEPAQSQTVRLLVRQYVRHGRAYQPLWQLRDALIDCFNDPTLGLLPGSTRVSDLDGNGHTETTLVYAIACRGGVDAAGLKLILHEGAAKYALRGVAIEMSGSPADSGYARRKAAGPTCCLDTLPAHPADYRLPEGLYANENDFAAAPPAFRAFARQQWRRARTRADEGTGAR